MKKNIETGEGYDEFWYRQWLVELRESENGAGHHLEQAITDIDKRFGDGYARAHPELVAAFMQSAATESVARAVKSIELSGSIVIGTDYDEVPFFRIRVEK